MTKVSAMNTDFREKRNELKIIKGEMKYFCFSSVLLIGHTTEVTVKVRMDNCNFIS